MDIHAGPMTVDLGAVFPLVFAAHLWRVVAAAIGPYTTGAVQPSGTAAWTVKTQGLIRQR